MVFINPFSRISPADHFEARCLTQYGKLRIPVQLSKLVAELYIISDVFVTNSALASRLWRPWSSIYLMIDKLHAPH